VITLNGNCGELPAGTGANGCAAGSPQEAWLESDLAAQPAGECEIAVWHQPRFSSGAHGNDVPDYEQFWRDLYAAGAEVVLNGHDHDYERFLPQRYDGLADPAAGITEFVVGTGGRSLKGFTSLAPNSAVRDDTHFGVLELTLHQGSYEWAFLPTGGGGPLDSGTGSCH
jgi:hypothetical protein